MHLVALHICVQAEVFVAPVLAGIRRLLVQGASQLPLQARGLRQAAEPVALSQQLVALLSVILERKDGMCVYVFMHVYTYVCVHTCMAICTHVCLHACVHACVFTLPCLDVYLHACISAY